MTEANDFSGKEVEGYKIIKPIGQGKFSTVYKAEKNNNVAALKKIKIFDMMDPKQREKCLKEVKLMQPLDHPNIIKFQDSFIHNNELIIITEWAEKGDLKRLLKAATTEETPFEEIKIWEYMNQIASALKHMHDKRIMHRDLKPANIFIAQDGALKVGDLGLGRLFSSETIEAYSKVGTPLYMSPELLHGEGYDMKSDVWSLGCVVYEMCELKSPFRNENEKMSLMDLFNNITKGEYKSINNKYSEDLRNIVSQMIVVDPQNRVDSTYVLEKSEEILEKLRKTPKIDCILVMEDIFEKLSLVDYHTLFCKPLKRNPLSKVYFAVFEHTVPSPEKFSYFLDLCYWIMNLPKFDNKNKLQAVKNIPKYNLKANNQDLSTKLISDIKAWGLKLPDVLNASHIESGFGDTVCFILNDLLNRELIRLNFKFDNPNYNKARSSDDQEPSQDIDPDLSEYEFPNEDSEEENDFINNPNSINNGLNSENDKRNFNKFTSANSTADTLDFQKQSRAQANQYERNEENGDGAQSILQSKIDDALWRKEYERVESSLLQFDREMKSARLPLLNSGAKEYQISVWNMTNNCLTIKDCVGKLKLSNLSTHCEALENDLRFISRYEKNINDFCSNQREDLRVIIQDKKKFVKILNDKTQSVQDKIKVFEELEEKNDDVKYQLEKKGESLDGASRADALKKAIGRLKVEITEMNIKTETIQTQLLKLKKQESLMQNNGDYEKHDFNESLDTL